MSHRKSPAWYSPLATYCSSLNKSKNAAFRLSGTAPSRIVLNLPSTARQHESVSQTKSIDHPPNLRWESGPHREMSSAVSSSSARRRRNTLVSLSLPTQSLGVVATSLVVLAQAARTA